MQGIWKPGGAYISCKAPRISEAPRTRCVSWVADPAEGRTQTFHVKRLRARLGSVSSASRAPTNRDPSTRERAPQHESVAPALRATRPTGAPRAPAVVFNGQDSSQERPTGLEWPPGPGQAHEPQRRRGTADRLPAATLSDQHTRQFLGDRTRTQAARGDSFPIPTCILFVLFEPT